MQASLSATKAEIDRVVAEGTDAWLDRMIAMPNAESASNFFARLGYDEVDGNRYFDRDRLTEQMIWSQLLSGDNAVRKRWALALSEFFVASANGVSIRWRSIAMGHYWDLLNRLAFGNFRDLLEEVSLSPAMGVFLDTRGNQKADPFNGREPDENFAREILQLFSIGLYELNDDGTPRIVSGSQIETYDNDDVTGLAKCFTGYDFDFTGVAVVPHPDNPAWRVEEAGFAAQPLTADPSRWVSPRTASLHSTDEKRFLGKSISQGTGPVQTLKITLDSIFAHPNVGPFFVRQMIQRLVTSNPSNAYVQRVAQIFNDNGRGVRGDLKAVFKAIILDDEARSVSSLGNPEFGKVREPMLRLVQWARTFGAQSASGTWDLERLDREYDQLSQSPLRAPSVFGYFRPTFVPQGGEADARSMVAPEFQLVNETSVVGYVNFMQDMIQGHGYSARDIKAGYSDEFNLANDPAKLVDHLDLSLTARQLSGTAKQAIESAVSQVPIAASTDAADRLRRVHTAVFLIMASPDYLVQK